MKTMMQKLVENQPTKTCLDAVKAARRAGQHQACRGGVAPLQRDGKEPLTG